jgi:hypothetical protein
MAPPVIYLDAVEKEPPRAPRHRSLFAQRAQKAGGTALRGTTLARDRVVIAGSLRADFAVAVRRALDPFRQRHCSRLRARRLELGVVTGRREHPNRATGSHLRVPFRRSDMGRADTRRD